MTEPSIEAKLWLTVDEAAALAGVTSRTIRSWLTKGHLRRLRTADGYHVRVARDELTAHLTKRREQHPGPVVDEETDRAGL